MVMIGNPVGDFLIRIKNAGMVGQKSVSAPFSKMKMAVAEVLKKEGYITNIEKRGKKVRKTIYVEIAEKQDGTPRISNVKHVSTPARRVYRGAKELFPVRYGKGLLVVSTPEGVMSGGDARKKNVGGEVLFEVF